MPNVAFVSGSIAGGGRFTASTPTMSYAGSGNSNIGKFNITNYNSSNIYTVSNGTVSGSVVTITNTTATSTITAKTPKGIYQSSSISIERKAPDQYYVVTTPFQCYGCKSTGFDAPCCAPGPCGCGTFHATGFGDSGFYACCDVRSYYYNSYTGSGYTWGGSDYTNGTGEWWKIT